MKHSNSLRKNSVLVRKVAFTEGGGGIECITVLAARICVLSRVSYTRPALVVTVYVYWHLAVV